jgi:DNA replication protein DnaC
VIAAAEYQEFLAKLKSLRLITIAEILDSELKAAASANMSYLDFLRRLIDQELEQRQRKAVQTRITKSRMPAIKTLESFDFSFQPSLNPQKIWDLATLNFIRRHENVIFLGPPGVGKTHLALGLGLKACQAGYKVLFTTLTDMAAVLHASRADSSFLSALKTFITPDLLIIDEMGYLPVEAQVANYLFQVVARRYEQGSIIITSNKSFADWGEMLGDPVLAGAILDRLLHHATVITINGPSYRLRERQKLKSQDANNGDVTRSVEF